jgi:class 3 adenylate cyclase
MGDMGAAYLLFAATFPERVLSLALANSWATLRRRDDYPWGIPAEVLDQANEVLVELWGTDESVAIFSPKLANDERFREWFARLERATHSPSTLKVLRQIVSALDVRATLPTIKAPALIVSHARHPYVRPDHSRFLAEHLPNAKHIERPGNGTFFWLHDVDWMLEEVQTFFTGTKGAPDLDDRILATVLFTDIVSSTERASALGDRGWRELLDEHDRLVHREIERFRGRAVKSTGDGILATFEGPARAIRCAIAINEAISPLGIEVRTGLHTGEVELRGEDIGGIAVHIGARVMKEAGPGEVLVSGAVPPLVAGSAIEFEDRGAKEIKGIPGEWRMFLVKT